MKNKDELLKEFERKFEIMKRELGFKTSLNELDSFFLVKDHVLHEGFVSEALSRQVCSRITETYMHWNSYLHSLIFPNPNNMINFSESQMFNEEEHKKIMKFMSEIMALVSVSNFIGISESFSGKILLSLK